MSKTVQCVRLKTEAEALDFPPLPGALGQRVFENVSKEGWAQWLNHQTMLINENRLSMLDPRARQYLLKQAEAFFFGDGADAAMGYVPPTD
ncbi:MAG: oxidative damage protection protein [Formosimonas sp.]|jgi:Fe-S cluster biosynthesis and repair protein YggX